MKWIQQNYSIAFVLIAHSVIIDGDGSVNVKIWITTRQREKITKIRNAFYYSMRQMLNNVIDLNNNWDLRVWNAKNNEVHTTTAEIRLIQINPMYGV